MEMFMISHSNYDYNELCDEFESIRKGKEESKDEFISRVVQIYYRFHGDDRLSKETFLKLYSSLLSISLIGVEHLMTRDKKYVS